MNIQEKYTVTEATALLGFKSRSTINKRTKSQGINTISYELNEEGNKIISIVELQRVFPDKMKLILNQNKYTDSTSAEYSTKTQSNTHKNEVNTMGLQIEVEVLREKEILNHTRINNLEKNLEDLRIDRNDWKHQAQKLLLENISSNTPENRGSKIPALKPVQSDNNNLGSSGREKGNNTLQTPSLFVLGLFIALVLAYLTKSFWLPFIN